MNAEHWLASKDARESNKCVLANTWNPMIVRFHFSTHCPSPSIEYSTDLCNLIVVILKLHQHSVVLKSAPNWCVWLQMVKVSNWLWSTLLQFGFRYFVIRSIQYCWLFLKNFIFPVYYLFVYYVFSVPNFSSGGEKEVSADWQRIHRYLNTFSNLFIVGRTLYTCISTH